MLIIMTRALSLYAKAILAKKGFETQATRKQTWTKCNQTRQHQTKPFRPYSTIWNCLIQSQSKRSKCLIHLVQEYTGLIQLLHSCSFNVKLTCSTIDTALFFRKTFLYIIRCRWLSNYRGMLSYSFIHFYFILYIVYPCRLPFACISFKVRSRYIDDGLV